MIPFNLPPCIDASIEYVKQSAKSGHICGDGVFTKRCNEWIEKKTGTSKALLTTSGTSALEMAARLCNLKCGDEVIMPSFTFPSTADAVIALSATPVFVDINPKTMNIDETKIEDAITPATKAIFVVHYAGVSCKMDEICDIAKRHDLLLVEDAAQGVMSTYKGKALGTFGDFGCFSFHETKNYSMGEGGALLIKDPKNIERAEILREKGTNRSKFFRGQIDKYHWMDYGSSYLPSDMNAAYLFAQLEIADKINEDRLQTWNHYASNLKNLVDSNKIEIDTIPKDCEHNAHMFFVKCKDLDERQALIAHLKSKEIEAPFHYVPLHSAPAGLKFGRFNGEDKFTTTESERLLRLPLYFGMKSEDVDFVAKSIEDFFKDK